MDASGYREFERYPAVTEQVEDYGECEDSLDIVRYNLIRKRNRHA